MYDDDDDDDNNNNNNNNNNVTKHLPSHLSVCISISIDDSNNLL